LPRRCGGGRHGGHGGESRCHGGGRGEDRRGARSRKHVAVAAQLVEAEDAEPVVTEKARCRCHCIEKKSGGHRRVVEAVKTLDVDKNKRERESTWVECCVVESSCE
jgi:hypothetical protein